MTPSGGSAATVSPPAGGLTAALCGNVAALVTPLRADARSLDEPALRRLVADCQAAGSTAVAVLGTTGEGPVLPAATAADVLRTAVDAGDVPVVCGVTANDTAGALDACRWAHELGAAAVLLTPPTYYRMGPATVMALVGEVAGAAPLPVLVDHMPGLTKTPLPAAALADLARHPAVAGVVEGSGDVALLARLAADAPPETPILVARAPLLLAGLAVGARGLLSPAGGCVPDLVVHLLRAWAGGDLPAARAAQQRLHTFSEVLHSTRMPTTVNVKVVLADAGVIGGSASPSPYGELTAEERQTLVEAARRVDVTGRPSAGEAGTE